MEKKEIWIPIGGILAVVALIWFIVTVVNAVSRAKKYHEENISTP